MDQYERFIIRRYAIRAVAASRSSLLATNRRASAGVVSWLYQFAGLLRCKQPLNFEPDDSGSQLLSVNRKTWAKFKPLLLELQTPQIPPPPSAIERRLSWLIKLLDLPEADGEMLAVAVRSVLWDPVHELVSAIDQSCAREISGKSIAALAGVTQEKARRTLNRTQPLYMLGMLESRGSDDWAPSETVLRIARAPTVNPDRLYKMLIGKRSKPQLAWQDFSHLGNNRDLAARLLNAALAKREKGINLLLYGVPGTGKTEFARTLAAQLNASALFVGEANERNKEPSRADRIAAFAILRTLTSGSGRTLLVMDEADDIFAGIGEDDAGERVGSKVFMNRLVEQTEAPTIWITNHPERLGPAVLRRMTLAIRFPEPDRHVRRRILTRAASHRKLNLAASAVDTLSAMRASPAILNTALRVAKLTGSQEEDAMLSARSILRAMNGSESTAIIRGGLNFDPMLSAADHNLLQLADRVASTGPAAFSFCFFGLSGTGKSAYARHLADRLDLDVLEKRASDILSMWIGETEKAIASAFEEAADLRAMLILDEADSLLLDRAGAQHSWEISQVNEMLTCMERHPYPFVCTTNLMESLDPATLRRFIFKVQFLPMTIPQARETFVRQFGHPPPPALDRLSPLTPGDFAVVARKAKILGDSSVESLVANLAGEVAAKPGASRMKIGFG